jgi:hypothetical protein
MRIHWQRAFLARLLIALFGLAQAALPGASAVVDATLGMGANPASRLAHAEDGRQPGCQFVHGPECVLCGVLTALAAPPRQPADFIVARAAVAPATSPDAGADAPLLLGARPRAPPLA